jgi:hypothetical protein
MFKLGAQILTAQEETMQTKLNHISFKECGNQTMEFYKSVFGVSCAYPLSRIQRLGKSQRIQQDHAR